MTRFFHKAGALALALLLSASALGATIGSSLSKPEDGTPLINRAVLDQISGPIVQMLRSEFDAAVTQERANITNNGTGVWQNGDKREILGEVGTRIWTVGGSAAASNFLTVTLPFSKTITLAGDANTVTAVAVSGVAPASGVGNNGDVQVDTAAGIYYTKAAGVWAAASAFLPTTMLTDATFTDPTANYGASCSAATTTGSVTASSTSLAVGSATGWNVGMGIAVPGAGTSGATLVTSVTAISGTTFTLATSATTTVSGATVRHDDTAALQSAISTSPKNVRIPAGNCNVSGVLTASVAKQIVGAGMVGRGNTSTGSALTNIVQWSPTGNTITVSVGYTILRDFSIQMASGVTPTSGYAIEIASSNSTNDRAYEVGNVLMYGTWGGLKVGNGAGSSISFGRFHDLVIGVANASTAEGLYLNDPSPAGDNQFTNIDIRPVLGFTTAPARGISIVNADVTGWTNIKALGFVTNMVVGYTGGGTTGQQRIVNSSFENNSGTGPSVLVTGAGTGDIQIVGSEFGNNLSGVGIEIAANIIGNVSIVGSQFTNLALGIQVDATPGQVSIIAPLFATVTSLMSIDPAATNVSAVGGPSPFSSLIRASTFPASRPIFMTTNQASAANGMSLGEFFSSGTATTGFGGCAVFETRDSTAAVNNLAGGLCTKQSTTTIGTAYFELNAGNANTLIPVMHVTPSKHIEITGTAPTISSCGTSPTVAGTDSSFTVTPGSGSPAACTVAFASSTWAGANPPHCNVTPHAGSTTNAFTYSDPTTTGFTVSQTGLGKFTATCTGSY